MRPKDIRKMLEEHGIKPRKKKGQHILIRDEIAERMVEYADLNEDDVVLEIGGGTGVLTQKILDRCDEVIVIENDSRMVKILRERFGDNIRLVKGNALDVDLGLFDKCVSNLPYQISSEMTFRLFSYDFDIAVMMYQKEFAYRMAADPGKDNYGRLSVSVNFFADVELLEVIPKEVFYPVPKVGSAIVKLTPREPPFKVYDREYFLNFVKSVFTQRRKKLKNAIKNSLHVFEPNINNDDLKNILANFQEILDDRPEKLYPEQFANLANSFYEYQGTAQNEQNDENS